MLLARSCIKFVNALSQILFCINLITDCQIVFWYEHGMGETRWYNPRKLISRNIMVIVKVELTKGHLAVIQF